MSFFPLFVELKEKKVLAVGAGRVGTRRIEALVAFGAAVTVVTSEASETVLRLAAEKRLRLLLSDYESCREILMMPAARGETERFFMVLTATGNPDTDRTVAEDGHDMRAFVNVAGQKEWSDFYFPGIVSERGITAGVIAGGENHRLARLATEEIREFIKKRADFK